MAFIPYNNKRKDKKKFDEGGDFDEGLPEPSFEPMDTFERSTSRPEPSRPEIAKPKNSEPLKPTAAPPLVDDSDDDDELQESGPGLAKKISGLLLVPLFFTFVSLKKGFAFSKQGIVWSLNGLGTCAKKIGPLLVWKPKEEDDDETEEDGFPERKSTSTPSESSKPALPPSSAKPKPLTETKTPAAPTATVAGNVDDPEFDEEDSRFNWTGIGIKLAALAAVVLLIGGGYFGVKSFFGKANKEVAAVANETDAAKEVDKPADPTSDAAPSKPVDPFAPTAKNAASTPASEFDWGPPAIGSKNGDKPAPSLTGKKSDKPDELAAALAWGAEPTATKTPASSEAKAADKKGDDKAKPDPKSNDKVAEKGAKTPDPKKKDEKSSDKTAVAAKTPDKEPAVKSPLKADEKKIDATKPATDPLDFGALAPPASSVAKAAPSTADAWGAPSTTPAESTPKKSDEKAAATATAFDFGIPSEPAPAKPADAKTQPAPKKEDAAFPDFGPPVAAAIASAVPDKPTGFDSPQLSNETNNTPLTGLKAPKTKSVEFSPPPVAVNDTMPSMDPLVASEKPPAIPNVVESNPSGMKSLSIPALASADTAAPVATFPKDDFSQIPAPPAKDTAFSEPKSPLPPLSQPPKQETVPGIPETGFVEQIAATPVPPLLQNLEPKLAIPNDSTPSQEPTTFAPPTPSRVNQTQANAELPPAIPSMSSNSPAPPVLAAVPPPVSSGLAIPADTPTTAESLPPITAPNTMSTSTTVGSIPSMSGAFPTAMSISNENALANNEPALAIPDTTTQSEPPAPVAPQRLAVAPMLQEQQRLAEIAPPLGTQLQNQLNEARNQADGSAPITAMGGAVKFNARPTASPGQVPIQPMPIPNTSLEALNPTGNANPAGDRPTLPSLDNAPPMVAATPNPKYQSPMLNTTSTDGASSYRQNQAQISPSSADGVQKYTVEQGDTYMTISDRAYGTSLLYRALALHNRRLGAAWLPEPGTQIEIPTQDYLQSNYAEILSRTKRRTTAATGNGSAAPVAISALSATSQGIRYVVQEGDTVFKIAGDRLRDTGRWREIMQLNPDQLRDARDLRPGMEIRLPNSDSATGTQATLR